MFVMILIVVAAIYIRTKHYKTETQHIFITRTFDLLYYSRMARSRPLLERRLVQRESLRPERVARHVKNYTEAAVA